MADSYSVVFRGDIVLGKNLFEVKQKLAQLFKVDDARIEQMFTGRPVPVKANIALVQAKKYQDILTQVGIVTEIIDVAAKKVAQKAAPTPVAEKKSLVADRSTAVKTSFSLAPVGSNLLASKPESEHAAAVSVAHLSLAAQEGNIIKDDERLAPLPSIVDADDLDWELTQLGEDLLRNSERREEPLSDLDTRNISLSEPDGDLLRDDEKAVIEKADIDTSHIKLSPGNTGIIK